MPFMLHIDLRSSISAERLRVVIARPTVAREKQRTRSWLQNQSGPDEKEKKVKAMATTRVRQHRRRTRSGTTNVCEHSREVSEIRRRKDAGEEISPQEQKLLDANEEEKDE
jgi:hypothetical protein